MTIPSLRRLVVLFALLLFPATSFAQEAILSGTVTDTTGGVLPGVVVTAVHEASGNSFETVTDSAGGYRISVRIGTYRIKLDLTGFATLERTGLQVQVGQQAVINLQMAPATLQEESFTGQAEQSGRFRDTASGGRQRVGEEFLFEFRDRPRQWLIEFDRDTGSRTSGRVLRPGVPSLDDMGE